MNPKANPASLLKGGRDRPMVIPMVAANHAARLEGYSIAEVVTQPQELARALFSAYRFYGYDGITVFTDTVVEAEAMGAQVIIPEDEDPFLLAPPQVSRLEPAEPEQDGRMPVVLEAIRQLAEYTGGKAVVLGSLKGPFSLAALLIGPERFFRDLIERPERVRELLLVATDNQRKYLAAIIEAGAVPFIGDPMASGSLISTEHFSRFAMPHIRELVREAHSLGCPVGLHICGDTSRILGQMQQTGVDFISIEDADLAHVRQELGSETVIMGSVSTSMMLEGSAEEVRQASHKCLMQGMPRLILSSACDVPPLTPAENIKAMVAAAREWHV